MILRPRQKQFVERAIGALHNHGNTLGVAPTGAGKTIMLSGVAGAFLEGNDAKACVLAHRDELTRQNVSKFQKVNPGISISVFDAHEKSWAGQTTFAMVQTLTRNPNLKTLPTLDLLVVDEAHHAAAPTYQRIIDHARDRNPDVAILGVTATPNRGDKQGLREIFSNVADQITLKEMVRSGHLVPPRTFVIDVGTQEALSEVKKSVNDFDMDAVDAIMNQKPVINEVIRHWKEKAGDRKTAVFCSTVDHAANVTRTFQRFGVPAVLVHGDLSSQDRRDALAEYEEGDAQVIVNVAVLTEGWDHPPTDCVVLLRPSSYKSTMIQMIGRGLRTIDPNLYPGVVKEDCIVLDFGISTLIHGSLEQDVDLDGRVRDGEAPEKVCPECGAVVPAASLECPICGHVFERTPDGRSLEDFIMTEVDLLNQSTFLWTDLFDDDTALLASGFEAWAGVFYYEDRWYAIGGRRNHGSRLVALGGRMVCLAAADDFLNEHEIDSAAKKTCGWLQEPVTRRQLDFLPQHYRTDFGLTRYKASCLISYYRSKAVIWRKIHIAAEGVANPREAA